MLSWIGEFYLTQLRKIKQTDPTEVAASAAVICKHRNSSGHLNIRALDISPNVTFVDICGHV